MKRTKTREYQVVILGASGFTGTFVVEEWMRVIEKEGLNIKWAVAGRSQSKLKAILAETSERTGMTSQSVPIIETDVSDERSLREMARRANLVLNCVGPYRFYGEWVYKACLESSTHYLDICGEPQFMEEMQLKYHHEAENKRIYMVSACGWGSVSCEVGVNEMKDHFRGELSSVESYLGGCVSRNFAANRGTWDSMVESLHNQQQLKKLRSDLFTNVFGVAAEYESKFQLERKSLFMFNIKGVNGWCFPYTGCDKSVVKRSQLYNLMQYKEKPVECQPYYFVTNFSVFVRLSLLGLMVTFLSPYRFGVTLLKKYCDFFSMGFYTDTPTREQINAVDYKMIFVGKGWDSMPREGEPKQPPNKVMELVVEGPHPGYPATAICLVQTAMTLLNETKSMPGGGVLTPGAAFRKTTLVKSLRENGLKVSTVQNRSGR